MIKLITTCNFDDLLSHSQSLGFAWNQAHGLLVAAKFHVGYLSSDHYKDGPYCEAHEHVEARKILKSFMNQHNIDELYITPKHYDA